MTKATGRTLRSARDLADAGLIAEVQAPAAEAVARRYAVRVTPAVADLIRDAGADDPVARQFVPAPEELIVRPEELADPIGDAAHAPVKGIVHRYPDRVLLKPVHVCAVYCRFCFRREAVGPEGEALTPEELEQALDHIRGDPRIFEVILSGGDPLVLSARRLGAIARQVRAIPHVAVLRVHTRVPVVEPQRVTPAVVAALRGAKPAYVVVHCNHPAELTEEAVAAIGRLVDAGIVVLSQSVLLRGVNDSVETLEALFRGLVRARVKPYYLHHPDLAPGTGHFRLPVAKGQALMRALRGRVSGLCLPTYVLDIPGGHGKVPVGPGYLETASDGALTVEDPQGTRHRYPPAGG